MEENSANDMFSFAAKYFRQDMEPGTIPSGQGKVVPERRDIVSSLHCYGVLKQKTAIGAEEQGA